MNDRRYDAAAKAIYESIWDERWDDLAENSVERAQYRQAAEAAFRQRAPAEEPFSEERAAMDDLNFLRERVFRHYASGDIVEALRAPVDLTMKVEPPELAARLYYERKLAALEIELLRERVSVMGRQR